MPYEISFQPIRVLIDGYDTEGRLVLADGQLAAVFVRLDGTYHDPDHVGWWHLEAGFGRCDIRNAPLFRTPAEAGAWIGRILAVRTA